MTVNSDNVIKGIKFTSLKISSPTAIEGLTHIIHVWNEKHASKPVEWLAYALATAYHETATKMQPIDEYGGNKYFETMYGPTGKNPARAKANGNVNPGDGAKYHGRGFVQLTWANNYKKMTEHLTSVFGKSVDLVNHPELAKDLDYATEIMFHGMESGTFTGKKFADYIKSGTIAEFVSARRIINGTDCADKIALYAAQFLKILK